MGGRAVLIGLVVLAAAAPASASHKCPPRTMKAFQTRVFSVLTTASCGYAYRVARSWLTYNEGCFGGCYVWAKGQRWACLDRRHYRPRGKGWDQVTVKCISSPERGGYVLFTYRWYP